MTNLLIVAQIASAIATVIKTIETRSVEAKLKGEAVYTGEFKLALALAMIETVYNARGFTTPFAQIVGTIKSTVSTLVAVYNALGLFKK